MLTSRVVAFFVLLFVAVSSPILTSMLTSENFLGTLNRSDLLERISLLSLFVIGVLVVVVQFGSLDISLLSILLRSFLEP